MTYSVHNWHKVLYKLTMIHIISPVAQQQSAFLKLHEELNCGSSPRKFALDN